MSLFHAPEFVRLHDLDMVILDGDGLLFGPARGSYGGFTAGCSQAQMHALLKYAARRCAIKLAPADYDLRLFSQSVSALHAEGFKVESADLAYTLRPLDINFTAGMSAGAAKKLAKAERAGFHSRKLERNEWRRAHALIHANRLRQGYATPIPLADIEAVESALPGSYLFFGTFSSNAMMAAAITVKVEADVLYIYAWADAEKNEDSPTTHLFSAIYEEACFLSCRLLDAGTCVANGVFNAGIAAYKESLGFRPSLKATMRRA